MRELIAEGFGQFWIYENLDEGLPMELHMATYENTEIGKMIFFGSDGRDYEAFENSLAMGIALPAAPSGKGETP